MINLKHIQWKKVALHALLWSAGFGIIFILNLLGNFSIQSGETESNLTFLQKPEFIFYLLILYVVFIILPVYFNSYFLIPKLWHHYNTFLYFITLIFSIIVFLKFIEWLEWITASPQVIFFFFVGMTIQTLIHLSIEGYRDRKRLETINLEQREMELKLLKTQINPHFLFNALNNLYSYSLFDPQQTPDAILRLSSLMRYSIEGSKKTSLSLEDEVEFIQSYIYLEQMRLNLDKVIMEVHFDSIPKQLQIAPMLLIPFVENAFKYGIAAAGGYIFIRLQVLEQNTIEFVVKNSIAPKKTIDALHSTNTGLQNTKRRLALLYTNRHKLDIHVSENCFHISLTLSL